MKLALYTITYSGAFYDGPSLPLKDVIRRAKEAGYDGIELEAKRPHGSPLDLTQRDRDAIRNELAREGLELAAVAAYNDFTSPIPEHRECQMVMLREQVRLAAELGTSIVRVFVAWPGMVMRGDRGHWELARLYAEMNYADVMWIEKWNSAKGCLREAVRYAEEYGVTMVLQNHSPVIRSYKDMLGMIHEVNSPRLRACLDVPIMIKQDDNWVRNAVLETGHLLRHSHFGGEFARDENGNVVLTTNYYGELLNYPAFVQSLYDIGYDGYLSYELCHPFLNESHEYYGLDQVHLQVKYACEYMRRLLDGKGRERARNIESTRDVRGLSSPIASPNPAERSQTFG